MSAQDNSIWRQDANPAAGPVATPPQKYFFVSRAGADKEAGKRIGSWLKNAGYRVFIQDWDIEPGQNFLGKVDKALADGAHVVALLSDPYFASSYCRDEWTAAVQAQKLSGLARLTPLRITDCTPPGLLGPIAYVDLFGFDEESARRKVLSVADEAGSLVRDSGSWPISSPTDKPRFTNLEPFDDAAFAGRTDELRELHASLALSDGKRVAVTALSGLGGVGKSALARAYCERHLADYEVIWWVRAESEHDVETDLAKLAAEWDPANSRIDSRRDQALKAVRVASTWAGRRPFLLVFDNGSRPSAIRPFRPGGSCRLLVTSRNTSWGREWRPMTVRKLDPDVAARLLLYATGRNDYEGARALANELDGLALPLTHAAAFLRENTATSFADFIRRFDELMQWQTEDADVRTTYATYSLAIANVFKPHPVAETVMSVAAYCAPESIPLAIFDGAMSFVDGKRRASIAGPSGSDRIKDAIGALGRYGLIEVESGALAGPSISVHRVLQRVVRKSHLDSNQIEQWGCAALRAIEHTSASLKEDASRHAQEALGVVPGDICRGTRASLRSLLGERSALESRLPTFSRVIGRVQELEQIQLLFEERGQHIVTLVGPGGIGKTALARLYADKNRRSYEDIWWIDASSEETLIEGLIEAGQQAAVAMPAGGGAVAARLALQRVAKASRSRPILLIYDDARDQLIVDAWRPQGSTRLLIISRSADWSRDIAKVSLAPLSMQQAIDLLHMSTGTKLEEDQARQIAEVLGGNPLSLRMAGTLLGENPDLAIPDLLAELRGREEGLGAGGARPVLEALVGRLAADHPAADALLSALAFCAADQIPFELIVAACRAAPGAAQGLDDVASINRALAALSSIGVVAVETDEVGTEVSAEPLALNARREALPPQDQEIWGTAALAGAIAAFPDLGDQAAWVLAERVANQGLAINEHVPPRVQAGRAALLHRIGTLRMLQGEFDAARTLLQRAISLGEEDSGFGQDELASCLITHSAALERSGMLGEAEQAMRRSLAISEATGNDRGLATGLNRLAQLYMQQGNVSGAEPLMQRALAVSEALGDSVEVANGLNNMASFYRQSGRPNDAEALVLRALTLSEAVLSPEHPSVIVTLYHLGTLLQEAGRLQEAEPVLLRAIGQAERVLGRDHPDVAAGLANLAQLFASTDRLEEAEAAGRRALAIWETSLGLDHPQLAAHLSSLGELMQRTGRHAEAMRLLQRALETAERTLGADHPSAPGLKSRILELQAASEGASRHRPYRRRPFLILIMLGLVAAAGAYLLVQDGALTRLFERLQ